MGTWNDSLYKELDLDAKEALQVAAGDRAHWDVGITRYMFYRKRGYSPVDALAYALAWCRNVAEQAERRKGHMTGCPAAASDL